MGMTVSITCDREGCQAPPTDRGVAGWYSVQHEDLGRDVWLCSKACLQQWAAGV